MADPARSEPDSAPPDAETADGLREKIRRLEGIIIGLETLIGQLKKNNDELRALKFGKRSEKLPPGQLALGLEDVDLTQAALQAQLERLEGREAGFDRAASPGAAVIRTTPGPRCLLICRSWRRCCNPRSWNAPDAMGRFTGSGRTSSDRLDIVPVQYFIRRTVRPKYACRACDGQIVQSPAPAMSSRTRSAAVRWLSDRPPDESARRRSWKASATG